MCPSGWFDLPRNYYSGYEQGEEVDDMEPSSSCSSPGVNPYGGELPLELVDDSSEIDGEVGKRLNQMVPVPHVPSINGEIPSVDEAISDHQRLTDRLRLYDLVELKVQRDGIYRARGALQFRALSDQFYRSPEHHKFVRQQLEFHRDIYEGYVPMAYSDYLEKVSQDGEWGDHVTLQAAADMYGVKIFVITSFKDTCYIEILLNAQKSNRVIFLSFWAEVRYNSIYPGGVVTLQIFRPQKQRRRSDGGAFGIICTQEIKQVYLGILFSFRLCINHIMDLIPIISSIFSLPFWRSLIFRINRSSLCVSACSGICSSSCTSMMHSRQEFQEKSRFVLKIKGNPVAIFSWIASFPKSKGALDESISINELRVLSISRGI